MQAGDICGTNSVAQGKQVCHCEGALRPWQSRSTRSDNRKASGEYGSVTQRGVEDAAPYKACAVDIVHGNLQLPKALNPRKGDAASVRRQSRQRLRSERRYRRNRLVRFCRQPVRIASAPPGGACRSPTTPHRYSANKQQKQGRTGLGASLFFQLLIPPPAWACRGAYTWSSSRRGGCSHSRCSGTGGRRAACAARRPCTPGRSRAARRPS